MKDDPAADNGGTGVLAGRLPGNGADGGAECVTFGVIFKNDLNPT
jgi:hypothetical protein